MSRSVTHGDQVEPRLKPDPIVCPCGCELVGQPRVKAWRDGLHHVRFCKCRRCVGSRQPAKARRREHKVARAAGGQREPMSGNLSGIDGRSGFWEWEETANVSLVRGFRRWVTSKQVTDKLARLMARTGSRRVFVLSWDGKPRWCVIPFEDWANQATEDLEAS